MAPHEYGAFYWCVKVDPALSPDGEIYGYADHVQVQDGCLLLCAAGKDGRERHNLVVAPGQWRALFQVPGSSSRQASLETIVDRVTDAIMRRLKTTPPLASELAALFGQAEASGGER
jgi:hypothetical protein